MLSLKSMNKGRPPPISCPPDRHRHRARKILKRRSPTMRQSSPRVALRTFTMNHCAHGRDPTRPRSQSRSRGRGPSREENKSSRVTPLTPGLVSRPPLSLRGHRLHAGGPHTHTGPHRGAFIPHCAVVHFAYLEIQNSAVGRLALCFRTGVFTISLHNS